MNEPIQRMTMAFLSPANRRFLQAVSSLLYANPFLPEMVRFERQALRREAIEADPLWSTSVCDPDRAARAIAMSRYVPFDENKLAFEEELPGLFFPIDIPALPEYSSAKSGITSVAAHSIASWKIIHSVLGLGTLTRPKLVVFPAHLRYSTVRGNFFRLRYLADRFQF